MEFLERAAWLVPGCSTLPVSCELPRMLGLNSRPVTAGSHADTMSHMRIPHTKLSPVALRAVVEEFVTRDGTDHSSIERRIESVLRHLESGRVEVYFDEETKSCNIVPT